MPITKEQWQQLEQELAGGWVNVALKYKGYELSITRERMNEATTVLVVYIDGMIEGRWICPEDALPADAPSVIPEVYQVKSKAFHSAKDIREIEKLWGKRQAKKTFPNLHKRHEWFVPYFSKASVLCRQFKKLEGLELVKANFLTLEQTA